MNLKNVLKENAPLMFSAAGIVGFVSAIVLTAKTAPKAEKILEEVKDEPTIEKVKKIIPIYTPVIGLTLMSAGCIAVSTKMNAHRYASLLALYSISERNLTKWQNSIIEEVGDKKYQKIILCQFPLLFLFRMHRPRPIPLSQF